MSSNSGPDIALIDYGASNLRSVEKAFEAAGCRARRVSNGSEIGRPSAIVVPGQGHFGQAMEQIRSRGFEESLRDCVLGKNIPYIGICIGFQILFDESEEAPGVRGLGWLKGKVVRFRGALKIPHMGWNEVRPASPHPAFKAIPSPFFYFVHSYYPEPADRSVIAATTDYGVEFTCAVHKPPIFAMQFHPEKSQHAGRALLRNLLNA